MFALLLAAGQQSGIFRDELYYIACANRLAWGYVDHPPLSIAEGAPLAEVENAPAYAPDGVITPTKVTLGKSRPLAIICVPTRIRTSPS